MTVRGVLNHHNHDPVTVQYEIDAPEHPDGPTGTMTAAPAALQAAKGGYATLELETGETIPIVFTEIAGNVGRFTHRPVKAG